MRASVSLRCSMCIFSNVSHSASTQSSRRKKQGGAERKQNRRRRRLTQLIRSLLLGAWARMKPPKHKIFCNTDVTVRPTCRFLARTQTGTTIGSHANQLSTDARGATGRDGERQNTGRNTEMSDGRNREIKRDETKRLMTFSGDRRRRETVSRRRCLLFKVVQWSGSCNELTIIHMSVTHTHLKLFKTFPALSLNPWCNICHWATGFALPSSFQVRSSLCFSRRSVDCFFYSSVCCDRWDHCYCRLPQRVSSASSSRV